MLKSSLIVLLELDCLLSAVCVKLWFDLILHFKMRHVVTRGNRVRFRSKSDLLVTLSIKDQVIFYVSGAGIEHFSFKN